MHIGYLCSRYPDVSHTFIQREIVALRELGLEVSTFSIRQARPDQVLSKLDREEWGRTYSVLPPRPGHHLRAHARSLRRDARGYVRTLWRSLRRAPAGSRSMLWRLFYFAEAVVIRDRCRGAGISHVHAHFANVGSDVAQLASELADGELSWSFSMHGSTEFFEVAAHRLADKVASADFVACVSDFTRSQLMLVAPEEHWDKLHVVRCAVDTGAFSPPAERPDDGPLRVLCVSRLVRGKGIGLLLDAIAALEREGVDCRLELVGDGPGRPLLERRAVELEIGDRVDFTGALGQDEIHARYAVAQVFCLPSFAEGLPVVLMEAMATGLPPVTTRISGIPELVEDEVSGLLVRPARADQLAAALRRLATDHELRHRLSRMARARVLEEYDLRTNVLALAALFEPSAGISARTRRHPRPRRASVAGSRR